MTVKDVITLAQQGELSQLAVKNNTDTVLGYLNLGLIELYKRFPIETEEWLLELEDGKHEYDVPADCMYIVAAYGEVPTTSSETVSLLNINTEDDPFSINTIGWNKIQVPVSMVGAYISLVYVKQPTLLTDADMDEPMALPMQMVEALLHYIGYRAHAAQSAEVQAEHITHYTRFEESCKKVDVLGVYTRDDMVMVDRIKHKGFV